MSQPQRNALNIQAAVALLPYLLQLFATIFPGLLVQIHLVSAGLPQVRSYDFHNHAPGFILFIYNSGDEENPEISCIPEHNH